MVDQPEDVRFLRGLASRLRALALTESRISHKLDQMAAEADGRADHLESTLGSKRKK
jgi:hypothetical protein